MTTYNNNNNKQNQLLNLYNNYLETEDLNLLQEITLHNHTTACYKHYHKISTLTLDEFQSDFFMRLYKLKPKTFEKEYKIKAYIKQMVRGTLLDALEKNNPKNIILIPDYSEFDTSYTDEYFKETYPTAIQKLFEEHPYTYDALVHKIPKTTLAKQYNINYEELRKAIIEDKEIIKEFYNITKRI